MKLTIFRILLVYAGLITFLHAVIPHSHHVQEIEHGHHHHHEHEKSLFDILELAFHNSQSFGSTDSFIVEDSFNNNDFINEEPQLLKWLRTQELFVYYTTIFTQLETISFYNGFIEELRGPPYYVV